jgi:hypothetical protein
MNYKLEPRNKRNYGDFFEVKDFQNIVKCGGFKDYDGSALAVKTENVNNENYLVSEEYINIYDIPSDVTHVWWFNK